MKVHRTSLISSLAMVALGAAGYAQQSAPAPRKVSKVGYASINVVTGEVTRGQGNEKTVSLAPTFTNSDTSGFFTGGSLVSSVGGPEEWLDWGIISVDTGSNIIGEFDFGYATSVLDVNNGGPGVQLTLKFYDGALGFCADTGLSAPTASFSFTGLPGVTSGGTSGWVITADLVGGFEFDLGSSGGAFGYSIQTTDDDGAGAWASGPLLCQAGDTLGGPDSNGQMDVFDIYDTEVGNGNQCLGSYFFGGPPSDFSSWYLEIRTAAPDPGGADAASAIQFNGSGVNANSFVVTAPPVLGGSFTAIDSVSDGGLGVFLVGYASPLAFPTAYGELLVNVADPGGELLGGQAFIYDGSGVASLALAVPSNLDLCGMSISSQTIEFGGGIHLHNGNTIVLGF